LDVLVGRARELGVRRIIGYYVKSAKNEMVADHYGRLGFELVERNADPDSSVWSLELEREYVPRNTVIKEIVLNG
jgi:predicted enzyme involved in methoxymalonyl-ACP biosynthesis